MDAVDRKILDILQFRFPLTEQPFQSIGETIGITEAAVISRIDKLKEEGVVRQISAIFDSAKIGYKSTLVAFRVAQNKIESVAAALNSLSGVSHNYLRDHSFNIWFTLTLPAEKDLKKEIAKIARTQKVQEWLFLPSLKTYKIQFQLHMSKGNKKVALEKKTARIIIKPKIEKAVVREVQKDLQLVPRPFLGNAKQLKTTEAKLLIQIARYIQAGYIKRFAAVLRQKKAGFPINVMVAWAPGKNEKDILGAVAAKQPMVSHCYERPTYPQWPYSLYTMIHAKTSKEADKTVLKISRESGVKNFARLPTLKEFKKIRVKYF